MSKQLQKMSEIGLVPLVVLEDAACAKPLGEALAAGGIPVAEVTFRTDACLDIIRAMKEIPTLIVGAGTVHTVKQAEAAVAAGATFIVTPAYNPDVIDWCTAHEVDIVPGTVSPGEIEAVRARGIKFCKFFPAAAYGGTATLKALAGPFADVQFLPTGGVSLDNMRDYLNLPNVAAVGGSFMTPGKLVKEQDWDGIAAVCRSAVQKMLGLRIGHVGIHTAGRAEAEELTDVLCRLTGETKIAAGGGFFAGTIAEICAEPTPGDYGHLCIDTDDMPRALAYYARRGIALDPEYTFRDENGAVRLAYLKEKVGGFSIHLRRA